MTTSLSRRRPTATASACALAVASALLSAGCGGGSGSSADDAVPTTSLGTSTGTTASSRPSTSSSTSRATKTPSSAAPLLADGRHPAYITKVQIGKRLVTVDVVQFFTGPAASTAASEDHAAEVPPPNDYWIRNASKRLRTLPITLGSPITVNSLAAAESGDASKAVRVPLAKLAGYADLKKHLFWVKVRGDKITALTEQFLP